MAAPLAPINVVLFDLGSTLIYFDARFEDVFPESRQVLAAVLREAGMRLDEAAFLSAFEARLRAYFQERDTEFIEHTTLYVLATVLAEMGQPPLPEPLLRRALAAMYAVSQAHWHVEEDAIPMLETLHARGCRLGIISNAADDADVQVLIDKAGIRAYFDYIISSAAAGIRKPNPRIFRDALAFFGARPGQAVMVGDTLGADILGARNAGLRSVWITRRADTPDNRDHLDTILPDAIIATLAELPDVLDHLQPV